MIKKIPLFLAISLALVMVGSGASAAERDRGSIQAGFVLYDSHVAAANEKTEKTGDPGSPSSSELVITPKEKSPVIAWALSFFFTMGIGQYYAGSWQTAIPVTVLEVASLGMFAGGAVKGLRPLVYASAAIFGAAWLFDWIYAIFATLRHNETIKEQIKLSRSIRPCFSFAVMKESNDSIIGLGITIRL